MPHNRIRDFHCQLICDDFLHYSFSMNTLSERLAWARQQKGLTQGELAKRTGSSQSTIGGLESGARLTSRNLAELATVLGVNALWLETGKGKSDLNHVEPVVVEKEYCNEIQRVIELMQQTDDRGRKKILIAAEDTFDMHRALMESMPKPTQPVDDVAIFAKRLADESLAAINKSEQQANDGHKTGPAPENRRHRRH